VALAVFIVANFVRQPVEIAFSEQQRQLGLRPAPIDLSLRDQLGQQAFVAALGGYRGLVATYFYLKGFGSFMEQDWPAVEFDLSLTTRLQPDHGHYWDYAAWMMGMNAAQSALDSFSNLSPEMRQPLFERRVDSAIRFGEEGLRLHPELRDLHMTLANIYEWRRPDLHSRAHHLRQAVGLGAPPYFERLLAYTLVLKDEPEASREAYTILRRHAHTRLESVVRDIKILEDRLAVPTPERIAF